LRERLRRRREGDGVVESSEVTGEEKQHTPTAVDAGVDCWCHIFRGTSSQDILSDLDVQSSEEKEKVLEKIVL
jgi:hypothetical protein